MRSKERTRDGFLCQTPPRLQWLYTSKAFHLKSNNADQPIALIKHDGRFFLVFTEQSQTVIFLRVARQTKFNIVSLWKHGPSHAIEIWLWGFSLPLHFDQSSDGLISLGSVQFCLKMLIFNRFRHLSYILIYLASEITIEDLPPNLQVIIKAIF